MTLRVPPTLVVGLSLFALPAEAQSRFATQVLSFSQGSGSGIFVTSNILGGPRGGGLGSGSLDVLTLGEGGSIELGFDLTIADGPGADFTVSENGFVVGGGPGVFAEVLFVEVSTDGATFVRFPTNYVGSGSKMGSYRGLAGGLPVIANVDTNLVSPFDPVASGGESFDLADLAGTPEVLSGTVDLDAIHIVRLVDALIADVDSSGTPLEAFGGADVDAVAVIHAAEDDLSSKPVCDLAYDDAGRMVLTLGDPQGFADLDLATARASLDLVDLPLTALLSLFTVQSVGPNEIVLLSPPVPGSGAVFALAVSVADGAGQRSGDQLMLQG